VNQDYLDGLRDAVNLVCNLCALGETPTQAFRSGSYYHHALLDEKVCPATPVRWSLDNLTRED
jgi:hypothetical protein